MTPEAREHLDKARDYLTKARAMLEIMHYSDEAARAAYLAGFHAAQALASERTGRIAKSHSGMRSMFAQLAKDDPRIDRTATRFLARAYRFKEIADYGTGPQAVVSITDAQEAIDSAARFIDGITGLLE
ncbi:MAG TPA: HEPN domain-containing protein [Stellaceae bacterium]|nr:HEPN domain-containing protein [Stellaceae bacterium]